MFNTLKKHGFLTNQSTRRVLSIFVNCDKTWVFDQSEHVQAPIYIIISNQNLY